MSEQPPANPFYLPEKCPACGADDIRSQPHAINSLGCLTRQRDALQAIADDWMHKARTNDGKLFSELASENAFQWADCADKLKQVKQQRDALLGVLRRVEWYSDDDGKERCPECDGRLDLGTPTDGHRETCRLHIAIADAEKEPK